MSRFKDHLSKRYDAGYDTFIHTFPHFSLIYVRYYHRTHKTKPCMDVEISALARLLRMVPQRRFCGLVFKPAVLRLFDWNETIDDFNERIYTKNYKRGALASRNMDDLILHEVAHFKTFESCKTWRDFVKKEREVRNRFIPGISGYNDSNHDGAETIAEGVVALRNGGVVPKEIKDLIEEYVRW